MTINTYHQCVAGWRPPPGAAAARDAAMFGPRQLSDARKSALVWTGLTVFPAACAESLEMPSKPLSRSNSDQNRASPSKGTAGTVERIVVGPWVPYRNYGRREPGYEHSRYVTYLPSTASKTSPAPRNLRTVSSIPFTRPAHTGIMPKMFRTVSGLFRHADKRVEGEKGRNRKKEKGKEKEKEKEKGKGKGKGRTLLV